MWVYVEKTAIESYNSDNINRYMQMFRFDAVAAELNVIRQRSITIIEEWPTQLKLKLGQVWCQGRVPCYFGFEPFQC